MSDAATEVRWRLLGPDTAVVDGCVVPLRARPRAVLLALLLQCNRPVSTEALVDSLWGDTPPSTARNSVARFVADLRRDLGDLGSRVRTVDGGYELGVEPGELDVDFVGALLAQARELLTRDPASAGELLTEARSAFVHWPNEHLDDLTDSSVDRRQHEELRMATIELTADAQLAQAHHRDAIADLEAAVDAYPFHERYWAQLMTALYRSGRQVEALRQYQRLLAVLDEVGVAPSPPVRQLEAEILAQQSVGAPELAGDEASSAPVTPIPTMPVHTLPLPRTSLVGREAELAALERQVETSRLVSIVGLGGTGKTRLAIAGGDTFERRGGDVSSVALGRLTDPGAVAAAVAAVVGLPAGKSTTPADVAAGLAARSGILLLDNCEHVLDAVRTLVDAVLDVAGGLTILTTSRVPLDLDGESLFRLGPLEASGDVDPAVALFFERARAKVPWLSPEPEVRRQVSAICDGLGRIPLAIELAAAQMTYLTPEDLLERLQHVEPADVSGVPGVDSLRAVLEWSWETLTAAEQSLLMRLSVFADTWTLEAATVVAERDSGVEQELVQLVDRSLVTLTPGGGRARYDMLVTVRAFAAAKLAESAEDVRASELLVGWVRGLLLRWTLDEVWLLSGVVDQLEPELNNITAALNVLRRADRTEELAEIAARCAGLWAQRGFAGELLRWLEPVVEDPELSPELRSFASAALVSAGLAAGDSGAIVEHASRAIRLADGAPHEWLPLPVASLVTLAPVLPIAWSAAELDAIGRAAADHGATPATSHALLAVARGNVAYVDLEFEVALAEYRSASEAASEPGSVLLLGETGEALSLVMAGRIDEARACVEDWRSSRSTDEWHYLVAIVEAIVLGASGEVERATKELAAAARELRPGFLSGRIDDFQMAFAVLADYRGDRVLAEELFADPFTRQPLLVTLVFKHLFHYRGLEGHDGWISVVEEILTRAFLDQPGVDNGIGVPSPEMLAWWTRGVADS